MLTINQEEMIKKYVDPYYFDVERLIQYLSIHSMVGPEVFSAVLRRMPRTSMMQRNRRAHYMFEEGFGFKAITTESFVRRAPFFFYIADPERNGFGDLSSLLDAYFEYYLHEYGNAEMSRSRNLGEQVDWEPLYDKLERMFYDFKIDLVDIMTYISSQTSNSRRYDLFEKWYRYLDLAYYNNLLEDVKPVNLLYSLNVLLERLGQEPILYRSGSIGYNEYFLRKGNSIQIAGEFPVNPETNEVEMRWVLVWVEGHAGITTLVDNRRSRYDSSLYVTIEIKLDKKTRIYLPTADMGFIDLYDCKVEDNEWEPIYIGPQAMIYDDTAIKRLREERKMTQKEVAEIIDVKLRTYQNWETGQSKPDTLDLIKLMNLFDIYNVQELI